MREIKFRGKETDSGKWIYGAFVPDATEETHRDMITWGFIRYYDKDTGHMVTVEVSRETVGQFTGLRDKNGAEIYEGDVCACHKAEISPEPFEIYWMDESGCWGWKENDDSCDPFYQAIANYTEVIGNIHDKE